MKLYLSSYKLGNYTEELVKWRKEQGSKIALIPDAKDCFPDGDRKETGIAADAKALENLGFEVTVIKLKNYFNDHEQLRRELNNFKAFFVTGGDAFVLRQAMMLSGFDLFLKEISKKDNYYYAGYSAGICVLAPNMKGLELVDGSLNSPYGTDFIMEGLAIVDYVPVPHFESDHPESPAINEVVKYLKSQNIKYRALRDGDVIIEDTLQQENQKELA